MPFGYDYNLNIPRYYAQNPTFRANEDAVVNSNSVLAKPIEKVSNIIENSVDTFVPAAEEKKKSDDAFNVISMILAILMAVGIFMVAPYLVSHFLLAMVIKSQTLLTLFEGLLRLLFFIIYVVLISLMKDIRRVYMYHGAEHKCINCIERGRELNVKNVMASSRLHKRCGTSFMLFVMMVSIIMFMFISVENPTMRVVIRILLVPVIAGVSYEFIRLAGSSESKIIGVLSKPGLWLQALTTREPSDDMIKVAVASVEAVFDWEAYLEENFGKKVRKKNGKKKGKNGKGKQQIKETKAVVEEEEVKQTYDVSAEEEMIAAETIATETIAATEEVKASVAAEKDEIASKFDWSFTPAKPEEIDEAIAKENRSKLAAKVTAADKAEAARKAAEMAAFLLI